MNDTQREIEDIYREYAASAVAGDLDRWSSLWVEDGVQLPPDAPMNVGVDAMVRWLAKLGLSFLNFDIAAPVVEVFGDTAVAHGTYVWLAEPTGGGEQVSWDGKFLTVFKRQEDGSWRIYRDIFNSNVPRE